MEELESFLSHINSQHDLIKFEATYSVETRTIPFLDMEVSISETGLIVTDLYKKDTAKVQYLLPSSCHPGHITKNIPYSLGYRLLRLCSERESFLKRLNELKDDLISRDYKSKLIDSAFEKVMKITRQEALKKVQRDKAMRIPLVVTYHPALPAISAIAKDHWKVMTSQVIIMFRSLAKLRNYIFCMGISSGFLHEHALFHSHKCGR